MTSAALTSLRNAILSNTLDAQQQGALATALAVLIPDFPTIDELSNAVPENDEVLAREWIAALYTLTVGDDSAVPTLQRVISPSELTSLPVPFTPGVSPGKPLFVADITPEVSGLLLASVNVQVTADADGVPSIVLFVVPLTSVVGGTPFGAGLTVEPTSTVPDFSTGFPVAEATEASFTDAEGNPHVAILTIASAPIAATVGQRIGIIGIVLDSSTQTWTGLSMQVSLIEQPLE